MALTKVTGGLISTTSNYEVGVITATKFVGPIEGGVTGITTGSDKIKVIDESSDTTCFPLFATHSDGYLAAKSGSNLTFNSNNGTLTATTFSGALTGNVNGNATGLSGTPSIVVKDITAEMVSVAGTVQYEDVVNVDATGIVTAGGGLVVPANKMVTITGDLNVDGKTDLDDLSVAGVSTFGTDVEFVGPTAGITSVTWDKSANKLIFKDNSKLVLGTGEDFTMYHDGSGNTILQDDNNLYIKGNSVYIQANQSEPSAYFNYNGAVKLYYDGGTYSTPKLETTATGVTVDGEVAATQDYPTIRPTLDLNFAATKTLDPRITYRRTGSASYTDEFGIVKLVGGNTPRFDHDPTTRECKGFLLEESRTNINVCTTFRRSADDRFSMNTAAEQLSGLNTNSVVGPDGTAKGVARAWFTGSEGNPGGSVYVMGSTSSSNGASFTTTNTHTASCWIRTGLETVFRMDAHSNYASASAGGSGATISFTFTLTGDGTVTTIESGGISATVTKYPNNWYRCTATFHRNSTSSVDSGYGVIIYPVNYASYSTNSQTGDIAWFWGPQVEDGTFPTSYIQNANDGTKGTRGKDLAEIDGEEFTEFFNQDEGTINCAYWLGNDTIGLRVFQINDSNNSVIDIVAGSGSGSGGYGYVNTGGSAQANGGSSSTNASRINTLHVTTLAYKENDVAGINIKNGTLTNDTSATLDGAYNRVTFYQGANGGDQLNGHLQRVQYYPKRLSDNQLKNLNNQ